MKKTFLLSFLFLPFAVFSQTILPLTLENGNQIAFNVSDIKFVRVSGSGSELNLSLGRNKPVVTETIDYILANSCDAFIDVVVRNRRTLVSKRHIDRVAQDGLGAKIFFRDGKGEVTTSTAFATVITAVSVPSGCGSGGGALDSIYTESVIQDATGADSAEVWRIQTTSGFYRDTSKIQDIENHGNILYVSKETGNNSTAIKGNPHFPWADPWTADTSANKGDLIYVLSGNWIGSTGSPGGDTIDVNGRSLTKGANYYWNKGTGVTITNSNNYALFAMGGAWSNTGFDILGDGRFEYTNSVVRPLCVYQANDGAGSATIKSKIRGHFINNASRSGIWACFSNLAFSSELDIDVTYESDIQSNGFWRTCTTQAYNSNDTYRVRKLDLGAGTPIPFFLMGDNAGNTTPNDSFRVEIDIRNIFNNVSLRNINFYDQKDAALMVEFSEGAYWKGNVSVNLMNYFEPNDFSTMTSDNSLALITYASNVDTSNISINIENAITNYNLFSITNGVGGSGVADEAKFNFSGKNCQSKHAHALFNYNLGGTEDYRINLSGNFQTLNEPCIVLDVNEIDRLRLSGRFETGAFPVINMAGYVDGLMLQDAVLINDGSVAAVQAGVATNVDVMGAYTNSLLTDADVTERVQSIVKNANVK